MSNKHLNYVNSTMDEVYELSSDLYEAMIDMDKKAVSTVIKIYKKILSDIQKSYDEQL